MAKPPEKKEDKKPSCFVIMPIADQKGYDDGHFTLVYEDIIKPAIIAAGMEVEQARADEVKNSNLIHLDILRKVIESDIAICDMSSRNPNVFYELGMRQAFDKPTVLIRDEDTMVPFDINGLRYVEYKKGMRHRDVVKAVEDLTSMLKATYEKKDDKSEVNSLIRLMDLTAAKVQHVELTEDEKSSKLLEIKLAGLTEMVEQISRKIEPGFVRKKGIPVIPVRRKTAGTKRAEFEVQFSSVLSTNEVKQFFNELHDHADLFSVQQPIRYDQLNNGTRAQLQVEYDVFITSVSDIIETISNCLFVESITLI
ncbi:hypothetical protein AMR76_17735 [Vibrio furnissii]|uniref:Uncharacterized protein n=1 Tax=Vibrio furnissii TaxID=29494 RepID=A0A0Q2XUC0_VIBFU|nr:hypothetical protein [Vibrio furnissii]KQH84644.1 hypothetical protein AMR76_17735 [Vibrio furnissii]